jgi:hypothetical protein
LDPPPGRQERRPRLPVGPPKTYRPDPSAEAMDSAVRSARQLVAALLLCAARM